MRKSLVIVSFLLTFVLPLPTLSLAAQFKVTRVYDGDTIKAEGSDIEIKVRLVGIDAPETSRKKHEPGQPYSQQSKKYLAGLISNRTVNIKGYGSDRYNRVLGVIYLDGKNINLEMVKAGMAEVYRGLAPYCQAEKEAKEAKKEMWSQGDKYISPREWRRMKRGQV